MEVSMAGHVGLKCRGMTETCAKNVKDDGKEM
jgi:hypothetical protein